MPNSVKATTFQVGNSLVLVSRNTDTNEMQLQDGVVTTPQTLASLAGLRNVTGVLVVGRAGTGAQYTTITSALAAVPASSSVALPTVILVCPGVYSENLTIDHDGVVLFGLGQVTLTPATNNPTVKIQAGVSTTPLSVELVNLKIVQSNDSQDCVKVLGAAASTVATGAGVKIRDCWLNPTGSGAVGVRTDRVGTVRITGCRMSGDAAANIIFAQTNSIVIENSDITGPVSYAWDDSGEKPGGTAVGFEVLHSRLGDITLEHLDATVTSIQHSSTGSVTVTGTESHSIQNSITGTLTVDATSAVISVGSKHAGYAGAGVFDLPSLRGVGSVAGATSVVVSLGVTLPDTNYSLVLTPHALPSDGKVPAVTSRQAHQFTVGFSSAETLGFSWVLYRT